MPGKLILSFFYKAFQQDGTSLNLQIPLKRILNGWLNNKKIASNALKLMVEYLGNVIGITTLNAFVMPENLYSSKILLNHEFVKEHYTSQEKNWGG